MALHLAFGWAKAYFEDSPIDPKRDCYDLGQSCDICHYAVNPTTCVRFCQCEKYSHYNCLMDKLAALRLDKQPHMKCQGCSSPLKVSYEMRTVFGPRLELCLLVELIIAIALIVQCVLFLVKGVSSVMNTAAIPQEGGIFQIVFGGLGLLLGCVWVAFILRRLLWKQQLKIKAIQPVPLDMQSKIEDFDSRLQSQSENPTCTEEIDFQGIKI